MLHYHLRRAHLQGIKDKYLAQVENVHSYELEEILQMMDKEESVLNADLARLALATFNKVLSSIIQDGGAVNLPFFKMYPAITGTFESPDASFTQNEHKVEMNLNLSKELQELLPNVKIQKGTYQPNLPVINEVIDSSSGSQNNEITVGGALRIIGSRLKIEGNAPSNGVYFVTEDGSSQTKVTTPIIQNRPSEVIVTVPDFTAGDKYTLKITNQYSGSNLLKNPRTGTSNILLTVK